MRRVVVTGMGSISPLGVGADRAWASLLAGRSGVRRITGIDVHDLPTQIAGQVPRGSAQGEFDPLSLIPNKEIRRYEDFMLFAMFAADEAIRDAELDLRNEFDLERTGVLLGSGIGGVQRIAENALILQERGPRRVSPYFITGSLINEAAGVVAIKYGLKGPTHSVVTACATGAHALGDASRLIALGDADVMIAGGTEAATCRLTLAGFAQMRAISTGFNDAPEEASRPWDRRRDGFVIGEGAGVVVLEEFEHARARGARIYAELLGYGLSGDAHHVSAPDPRGDGARRAMAAALARARVAPGDIGYLNAHATSTPAGDPVELHAIRALFGEHARSLAISATKSATGHLLGAAGAVEAIFTIQAMRDGLLPPTLNLHEPEDDGGLELIPLRAIERSVRYAVSNSFGFGGTNAALVFGRV